MLIQDREKTRVLLLQHFRQKGLRDEDEVSFYIREYLGLNIPTKAYCVGHDAPIRMIIDLFFEKVGTALGWANRTGGKTMGVAVLNHLDMEFKPGVDICVAASTMDQARKGYNHFKNLYSDPLMRQSVDGELLQSQSKLKNGSVLEIITGTVKGVNSPHPNKARLDEVELMAYEVFQEAMSMSMSKGGYRAQDVYTSTRKKSAGLMNRLITEAPEKGTRIFSWCIWDVVEKCERECKDDPKYGNCPIYHLCGGIAHEGTGWYQIPDLIKKVLTLSKDVFDAQWLNKKPGSGVLVYNTFSPSKSIIEPFELPPNWPTFAYLDFGANFYYGKVILAPTGHYIVYAEYWWPSEFLEKLGTGGPRTLEKHAEQIRKFPRFRNSEPIFADPAEKQSCIEVTNQHHMKVIPAEKTLSLGMNDVRSLMEREAEFTHPKDKWVRKTPLLLIMRGIAPRLIWELEDYACETNPDGSPNRDEPDHTSAGGAHAVDAFRYGVRGRTLRLDLKDTARYRLRSLPGF